MKTFLSGGKHVRYLDSTELHHWLQQMQKGLDPSIDKVLSIPIFLFDFDDSDLYLLDKQHQALSFPDMVIAVQAKTRSFDTEFTCDGQSLDIYPQDATRSVLAATLQTVWGVAPTNQRWSSIHGKPEENYLWSLGNTPFGSFSNSLTLSFSQHDAASKGVLYTELHNILEEVNGLFAHFSEYDKTVAEVLSASDHLQFTRRWNIFQYKLGEARKYLSLQKFESSFLFVQSLQHDVTALHKLIHLAGKNLHTYLHCAKIDVGENVEMFKWAISFSPVVVITLLLAYLMRRNVKTKTKSL